MNNWIKEKMNKYNLYDSIDPEDRECKDQNVILLNIDLPYIWVFSQKFPHHYLFVENSSDSTVFLFKKYSLK